jgi:hypothetical protein
MCSSAQYNTLTRLPDHAWPKDQDIAATPWADIHDNPSDYYDTNQFALPVLLQSPDHMSLTDVLKVAEYLASHSFLFYPKANILDKRRTRKAEEEAQDDDEEEVNPLVTADVGGTPGTKLDEEEVDGDAKLDEEEVDGDAKLDEEEVDGDAKLDEEEVDSDAKLDEEEVDSDAKLDEEEVEEGTEHDKDAKTQPPPCRTSRTKRSAPDNSADADAPVRKSMRLQKEIPAVSSARPLKRKATTAVKGSGADNKVCSMPSTDIVPPS